MVAGAITGGLVGRRKVMSNSTYKKLLLMGAQGPKVMHSVADIIRTLTGRAEKHEPSQENQPATEGSREKASAKLAPRKPKYISKADRLKLDAESTPESVVSPRADTAAFPGGFMLPAKQDRLLTSGRPWP